MNATTNPNCHACSGSGIDAAFGTDCSECLHESLIRQRYAGIHATTADRAYTPGERLDGRTFGSTGTQPSAKQVAFAEGLCIERGVSTDILAAEGVTKRDMVKLIEKLLAMPLPGDGPIWCANRASDKQIAFIESLLSERDRTDERHAAECETIEMLISTGQMNKKAASASIELLLSIPKKGAAAPAPAEPGARPEGARDNRYDATCSLCGQRCDSGTGWIVKGDRGWITTHNSCPEAPAPEAPAAELPDASEVPAGFYAIASTGDNDLAFYRIDRPTEGAYAGRVFVKMMIGGHPDSNVRYAAVPGILARIAEAGADAAGQLYAAEFTRCYRCNRTLTDEESRAAGLGPICRTLD